MGTRATSYANYSIDADAPAYVAARYRAEPNTQDFEFLSGERICPPRGMSRRARKVRSAVLAMAAGTCGWVLIDNRDQWPAWRETVTALVALILERAAPSSPPPVTAPEPAPLAVSDVAAAPPVDAGTPAPVAEASQSDANNAAAAGEDAAPDPLPPPQVDPADPYQKRAAAVGLHPDISRAVLARLSAADYRNAGIAIKTALAETAATDVFAWPKQRKPELALFEVHFVRGAAGNCRRYVVTITKDGWLTTAPPMEKCTGSASAAGAAKKPDAG